MAYTYTVANTCNSVVGTVTPSVPATIATNLQASGGGTAILGSSGASFKLTGWTGTPSNDPSRYHAKPILVIVAALGSSGTKMVVTAFDSVGVQRATWTFTSAGSANSFYTLTLPLVSFSDPNWTLQISVTAYVLSISVDQVYVQYLSAGAFKDLSPVSYVRGAGWTRNVARDQYQLFPPPTTQRSTRMTYQYGSAAMDAADVLVAVTFVTDPAINWASHAIGTTQIVPWIYCQQWPLASPIGNTPASVIEMNVIDGEKAVWTPRDVLPTPFEWGDVSYNWTGGWQYNGGYVPDLAKLNGGLVSCGIELDASNIQAAGSGTAVYSLGGDLRMRIYYDPAPVRNYAMMTEF